MIPVARVSAPPQFRQRCRDPGEAWLAANPDAKRPRDYWSQFKPHLADGFANRCGYSAMYEPVGSVDHFRSWDNHPELAYDWRNYRYAAEWINKSKQTADDDVLDPYEVQDAWFEITLPDLQLRVTDRVPAARRARATYTLTRLHLRDDERVIRQRRQWYKMFEEGKLTIDGLAIVAPLIAAAVRKVNAAAQHSAAAPAKKANPKAGVKKPKASKKPKKPSAKKKKV